MYPWILVQEIVPGTKILDETEIKVNAFHVYPRRGPQQPESNEQLQSNYKSVI